MPRARTTHRLNSRRSITDKDADVYDTGSFGLQVFNPHQRKKSNEQRVQVPRSPRPLVRPSSLRLRAKSDRRVLRAES